MGTDSALFEGSSIVLLQNRLVELDREGDCQSLEEESLHGKRRKNRLFCFPNSRLHLYGQITNALGNIIVRHLRTLR